MREKSISQEALAVLTECTQEGQLVKINSGQLPRPLYVEVNAVLDAIGGKWSRKHQGHIFTEPASEVADMLEQCIQTGKAIPLRPAGYFPTPPAVVKRMIEVAQLQAGMVVLEPSAGTGAIVGPLLETNLCLVDAVEIDHKLARDLRYKLENPHLNVDENDFFKMGPLFGVKHDRVLMNPPFIRLSEIDHIMHAWKFLKPGGRLVSVASASVTFHRAKKAVEFREFVAQYGRFEKLPEGSFKDSGTMVNCVLVILDKRRAEGRGAEIPKAPEE